MKYNFAMRIKVFFLLFLFQKFYFAQCSALTNREKLNATRQLTDEILSLMDLLKPTKEEVIVRQDLIKRFREAVAFINPEVKVELHGSYASDLYLPKADMDFIVLNWTNSPDDKLVEKLIDFGIFSEKELYIHKIEEFDIIKTRDFITSIKMDICNKNSESKSLVITDYLNLHPAIKPLFLTVKLLLEQRNLHDYSIGGFKGYFLFWIVTSFAQVNAKNFGVNENYGELLLEFFNFYGNLNYFNTGIRLVDESTCYTNPFYQRKSLFSPPNCYDLPISIPLSMSDFKELTLNGVTKFPEVQQTFRVCHNKLLHALHNNHPHILSSIIDFNNIRK